MQLEPLIAKLLQDFEQGKMTRRQLIQSLALSATAASAVGAVAAADTPAAKALYVNHISYQVADYTKTRDFYASVLGMKVSDDDGKECRLVFGDNMIVARNRPSSTTQVDHIAYTVANWETNNDVKAAVEAELKRRGESVGKTPTSSVMTKDPDGFSVQIGGENQFPTGTAGRYRP